MLGTSALSNSTLVLPAILWTSMKGVFITMRPSRRLWLGSFDRPRFLSSKFVNYSAGDIGGRKALFEQTIDDS
jgi:hypothetical protein